MNIRFLAPCLSDLTAHARLIKFGRSLCPVHVDLFDAEEKHVAVAQVSYLLLDRIPHDAPKKA
jgi:acyl-coenzyme A thioesterase PaaI-like protein